MYPARSRALLIGVLNYVVILVLTFVVFGPFPLHAANGSDRESTADFREAMRLFKRGDFKRSQRILRKLSETDPKRPLYLFNWGNACFMTGDWSGAISAYDRATRFPSQLKLPAKIYLAKSYRKKGQLDEASRILQGISSEIFSTHLAAVYENELITLRNEIFREGLKNYQGGNFAEANRDFEEISNLKSSRQSNSEIFAQAATMQGLCLLKLQAPTQAEQAFGKATQLNTDSKLRGELLYFTDLTRDGKKYGDAPYWALFELGLGYNSNVYQGGSSAALSSSPGVQSYLGAGYRFYKNNLLSLSLADSIYYEEFTAYTATVFFRNSVWLQAYRDSPGFWAKISPTFQYENLNSQSYLFKPGVSLGFGRKLENQELGLAYEYFQNTAGSAGYNYLNGYSQSGKAYWSFYRNDYALTPFIAISQESDAGALTLTTGTVPLSNFTVGPGFSVLTWQKLWEISGSISYLFRTYSDLSQPTQLGRSDQQLLLGGRLKYRVKPNFSIYFSPSFTLNRSTLGVGSANDENYQQLLFYFGTSWDLLP